MISLFWRSKIWAKNSDFPLFRFFCGKSLIFYFKYLLETTPTMLVIGCLVRLPVLGTVDMGSVSGKEFLPYQKWNSIVSQWVNWNQYLSMCYIERTLKDTLSAGKVFFKDLNYPIFSSWVWDNTKLQFHLICRWDENGKLMNSMLIKYSYISTYM